MSCKQISWTMINAQYLKSQKIQLLLLDYILQRYSDLCKPVRGNGWQEEKIITAKACPGEFPQFLRMRKGAPIPATNRYRSAPLVPKG